MSIILDGKKLAETIRKKIKSRISSLPTQPGLAVILVGDDPASRMYVGIKEKACHEVGIRFEKFLYSKDASEQIFIDKIHELNARDDIHGILVQLPLPEQNADRVIDAIDPKKDVDGFHPTNLNALRNGRPTIASAVALGVMKLIDVARHELDHPRPLLVKEGGSHAAIVSSDLFAEPLKILLKEQNISSQITRPDDPKFKQKTSSADVLIVAMGMPRLITGDLVKPGAIVIDVGTTKIDGILIGDVDRSSVEPIAGALSPVPGGVGPMTVAMLLVNVVKAFGNSHGVMES